MIRDKVEQRTVRSAIELAGHAPSIHNSQPWHWTVGRSVVHLTADRQRWLPATDADGRDLALSCGAALHHLRVALAAAGVHASVHRMPDPGGRDRLATLELSPGVATDVDLELAAAIVRRRTDRRPFGDWSVSGESRQRLETAATEQGAILRVVGDGRPRSALLEAIRDAAARQRDLPGYLERTPDGQRRRPGREPPAPRRCRCPGGAQLRERGDRPGRPGPG